MAIVLMAVVMAIAVHADEHAGAMYVTMTMMRPGLFLQREEPGSEPGNSLVRPDDRGLRVRS